MPEHIEKLYSMFTPTGDYWKISLSIHSSVYFVFKLFAQSKLAVFVSQWGYSNYEV